MSTRTAVGVAVTTAWLLSLVSGTITHDYNGLELVTPIMLVYVSFLYGDSAIKRYFGPKGSE